MTNRTPMTRPQSLTLSQLALIQLVTGAGLALVGAWLGGLQLGASIAFGAGLMLFNVVVLGWSWRRLMAKKSIAWTVGIIVIKYAVLLGSLYYLSQTEWLRPLGVVVGVFSFMIAALIFAAIEQKETKQIG